MSEQQLFQERVVKLERPKHHFVLLIATDGAMLGLEDGGDLALYDEADDRVIWDRTADGVRHVASGVELAVEIDDTTCVLPVGEEEVAFTVGHGPEKLPSEYLEHLQREGWVCLTCILTPDVVEDLERVAGTDRYEHLEMNSEIPKVCQSVAVGRAITEPISIWLARQYMQARDLHLGHPPGFRVLGPDDGKSKLGGWHSDFPYTASTGGDEMAYRKEPVKAMQRNVCVSDFTRIRGATAFKLGSHLADTPPPPEWNDTREGRVPYSGPEADVVEAPGGSIILYDARMWHRAGINRSQQKRAAMLQSFQVPGVMPKTDTRNAYKLLVESPVYNELNAREQREITGLLTNQSAIAGS